MKRDWLWSDTILNVVALGIVAIVLALVLFTVYDFWILLTGELAALSMTGGIFLLIWALFAALFSCLTVFICQPGIQRVLIALFSISMASHALEQSVVLPVQQLKLLAFCRIAVALGLILIFVRYRSTAKTDGVRSAPLPNT